MLADGDRTDRLKRVRLPTLVLHGELDPLLTPAHGRAIADVVNGVQFVIRANWGHGTDYSALWPALTEHIINFQKAHPV